MYSIPKEIQQQYSKILEFIYHTILISSTILLTYPIWPPTFKQEKFIIIAWLIAVSYLLVFALTILVILSQFGQYQLMIFLLNMMVISLLLRWQVAIVMICFTVFFSIKFYKWYVGAEYLTDAINISLQFKIMYALLLISSVLIAFLKLKQDQQELAEEKNEHLNGRITS